MNIYLDYAATTPLDERVLAAMTPYWQADFANPSSLHAPGQRARRAVEEARERVAAAIGGAPKEIIFCSGATEAANHALRAVAALKPGGHIVTSALEHSAVLASCRYLEKKGHPVSYLKPDEHGEITPAGVKGSLREETILVALMHVNNETGIITDVAATAKLVHEAGALLFCDAVQSFGLLPLDVGEMGADLLSLSGHKIYGPKGVGVLYARAGTDLPPLLVGGEQERGLRAGTLNTPAVVGMGLASELASLEQAESYERLASLQRHFIASLSQLEGVRLNGLDAPRSPKQLSVSVAGADGEALLMNLDRLGVYASSGSACAAGTLEPSHVLLAMGLEQPQAKSSLRFSLGRALTPEMLDEATERLARAATLSRA